MSRRAGITRCPVGLVGDPPTGAPTRAGAAHCEGWGVGLPSWLGPDAGRCGCRLPPRGAAKPVPASGDPSKSPSAALFNPWRRSRACTSAAVGRRPVFCARSRSSTWRAARAAASPAARPPVIPEGGSADLVNSSDERSQAVPALSGLPDRRAPATLQPAAPALQRDGYHRGLYPRDPRPLVVQERLRYRTQPHRAMKVRQKGLLHGQVTCHLWCGLRHRFTTAGYASEVADGPEYVSGSPRNRLSLRLRHLERGHASSAVLHRRSTGGQRRRVGACRPKPRWGCCSRDPGRPIVVST